MLLPELAGQQDVAADLRDACHAVLRRLLGPTVEHVIAVGGAPSTAGGPDHGAPEPRTAPRPPLSLRVARRLLDETGWRGPLHTHTVAFDAPTRECLELGGKLAREARRGSVLLVMGDGSARRGPRAPGYFDPRAHPFDDAFARALRDGEADALAALDPELARDLLAQGRAAVQVLAGAARQHTGRPRSELAFADDPFGVMYLAALWRW